MSQPQFIALRPDYIVAVDAIATLQVSGSGFFIQLKGATAGQNVHDVSSEQRTRVISMLLNRPQLADGAE
jgi:hypothetical protein